MMCTRGALIYTLPGVSFIFSLISWMRKNPRTRSTLKERFGAREIARAKHRPHLIVYSEERQTNCPSDRETLSRHLPKI